MLINKKTKKYILVNLIILIIFIIIFLISNSFYINKYIKNDNIFLNNLINKVLEKYPEVTKEEIVDLLNNKDKINKLSLLEYGINLDNSYVLNNNYLVKKNIILNIIILITLSITLFINYYLYLKRENRKLKEILKYLKDINRGLYNLKIEENEEDDLSLLKNELAKTTIMLKEVASNNLKDKVLLKESLEDLSHQLRTPLTSITLILDSLNSKEETDRLESYKDMKRLILNLNFLVNSLLKLARFDANTITFKEDNFLVDNLLNEVIENVNMLADLKNIKIIKNNNINNKLKGDFKWQVEAITNIIKNCIEHSKDNSFIEINHDENKLYTRIIIKDQGVGISKNDLKHIFERFYKGKNSSCDSVGIGLALAKTIIEKDNGFITVTSKEGVGTTFIIKYLK